MDPLPHGFAAREAVQWIKPPDSVALLRPIERRCLIEGPGTGVAQLLRFGQIGFAAAQSFRTFTKRLIRSVAFGHIAPGAAIAKEFSVGVEDRFAAGLHVHWQVVAADGAIDEVAE